MANDQVNRKYYQNLGRNFDFKRNKLKPIFMLLIVLFSASIVSSHTCDYYTYEEIESIQTNFYLSSKLLDGNLDIENTIITGNNVDFVLYNPFDFEIEVKIEYVLKSNWFGNRPQSIEGVLPSKEFTTLRGTYHSDSRTSLSDVNLIIVYPNIVRRVEKVVDIQQICMVCGSSEIFCESQNKCIAKASTPLDIRPSCDLYQECESQYISPETGLCAKSPSQLRLEEQEFMLAKSDRRNEIIKFTSIILLGLGGGFLLYLGLINLLRYKTVKILKRDYDRTKSIVKKKNAELFKHKRRNKRTIKEIKKSHQLKSQLEKDIRNFKSKSRLYFFRKYNERYSDNIYIDDKGYFRFKDSDVLLHKYIFESHYGKTPRGCHIHHIDANHYNNEIWNLIAISSELHKNHIKHGRIGYEWESGIAELKRIGLTHSDFPIEVINKLIKSQNQS